MYFESIMFVYGSRLFGKVEAVPGVLHVATRFIHISFIPCVPTSSWLVLDKNAALGVSDRQGVRLAKLHWRSIAMAWFRTGLIVAAGALAVVGATTSNLESPLWKTATTLSAASACIAVLVFSYRLARATPAGVEALQGIAGVPDHLFDRAKKVADRLRQL